MIVRRTAAASLTAFLVLGGATAAVAAESSTSTPDPVTAAPVATPQDFSVTLAGLGDVVMTVDTTTGEILNVVVTPLDGITAGDPVPVHEGIRIDFTLADGTVTAVVLEVENEHGQVGIEIETEDEDEQGDDHHQGPPPISDRGVSEDHRNDEGHRNDEHDLHGPDVTTSPTTQDHDSDDDSDDQGEHSSSSDSDSNSHTGSGGRD